MNRVLVCLLALLVRIPFLTNPLWNDELVTIRFLREYSTTGLLLELPLRQPHFPLYYILVEWGTFTLTFTQTRVLSLVASLGVVWLTMNIAERMETERVSLYAGVLVALSPVMVLHGTWLRMYALLAFVFLCSLRAFIERHDRAWALSMVALVWIHPFGMFILLAYLAYAFVDQDRDALLYSLVPLFASVPGTILLLAKIVGVNGVGTAGLIHQLDPTVLSVSALYGSLLTGRIFTTWQLGTALYVSAFVLAYALRRRDVTLYLLVVPVLVTVGLSVVIRPVFQMKYLAFLAPLVAIYFGMFLADVSRRQRIALGGALLLNYAIAYSAMFASKSPWIALRVLS